MNTLSGVLNEVQVGNSHGSGALNDRIWLLPQDAAMVPSAAERDANLVSFVEPATVSAGDEAIAQPGEEEPPKNVRKLKGGWAVIRFTKKSWAAIQNDPTARAKTEQLHLSADCFDA